jgi:hypothetical protein
MVRPSQEAPTTVADGTTVRVRRPGRMSHESRTDRELFPGT